MGRIGAAALTLTAFLATGSTAGPIVGAALGLAHVAGLCCLLDRRAIRLNAGVSFSRTAIALIVIAAGVLAYGLGDLQDAGLLPGQRWVAVDLTGHVGPGSWWVTLVTGITELAPRMTVLQVMA
jgi:high-affinity iron transporter